MRGSPVASAAFGSGIDDGWYRAVTRFAQRTGWLQSAMSAYTSLSIVALAAALAAACWLALRRGDRDAVVTAVWTGCGTLLALAAGLGLKQVFAEPRPCNAMPHVVTVQPCPPLADYSFPSDHVMIAASLAVGLWLIDRRLGVVAIAVALLEGFSRVYLGQHYPHDVIAALVAATVIVVAGRPLARRPLTALLDRRGRNGV